MSAPKGRRPWYLGPHLALRREITPAVLGGQVVCWRCGKRIRRGEAWDLGHVDGSRTEYAGPEHSSCNRSAAGRRGHALARRRVSVVL